MEKMIEKNNRMTIYKNSIIYKLRVFFSKILKKKKSKITREEDKKNEVNENNKFDYLKFNVDNFYKLREKDKFLDEICEDKKKFDLLSINQLNVIVDYYENKLKKLKNS